MCSKELNKQNKIVTILSIRNIIYFEIIQTLNTSIIKQEFTEPTIFNSIIFVHNGMTFKSIIILTCRVYSDCIN